MEKLSFKNLNLKPVYSSDETDLIDEFYKPIVRCSARYDRASGYFSKSIFNLMYQEIMDFSERGGKLRLVCSHEVFHDQETVNEISQGYLLRKKIEESFSKELSTVMDSDLGHAAVGVVATLIRLGNLEVKIAVNNNLQGIFHEKYGIFKDFTDQYIAFAGSNNETVKGWKFLENSESFSVYSSWELSNQYVEEYSRKFEKIWHDNQNNAMVIPFNEISLDIINKNYEDMTIKQSFEVFKSEYEKYSKINGSESSYSLKPMDHQKLAIEKWEENNFKGIFEHCTGSGKTFTAILAIKKWIEKNPKSAIIILVPSSILLEDWGKILKLFFKKNPVKLFGNKRKWNKKTVNYSTTATNNPSIVVATIDTASSIDFIDAVNSSHNLMLIADEVHWLGAGSYRNILDIESGASIGLSATPERHMDPEGTKIIFDYFKDVIHKYEISDAIKDGVLTEYFYLPQSTNLTTEEIDLWIDLTKKIKKLYAKKINSDKNGSLDKQINHILFNRADIIKNAKNKIEIACNIIKENFSNDQRWIIYCDDKIQLKTMYSEVKKLGFEPQVYFSKMESDENAVLENLNHFGGILIAIKCLDEGVDIPAIDNALILASSKNPREYIQRRGRILRKLKNKRYARLFDIIISPIEGQIDEDFKNNMLRGELNRAFHFSNNAKNSNSVQIELIKIADDAGIVAFEDEIDVFGFEEGKIHE